MKYRATKTFFDGVFHYVYGMDVPDDRVKSWGARKLRTLINTNYVRQIEDEFAVAIAATDQPVAAVVADNAATGSKRGLSKHIGKAHKER